jgi:predicted ATPase/class 3 adenylate cyclase
LAKKRAVNEPMISTAPSKAQTAPTGTVTFLFTDIEGSSERWERDRSAMQDAVRRHDALMRSAIEAHHGLVFKTIGDAFCAAFALAPDAVAAALDAQRALASDASGDGLRVRMALHTGNADERDGDYFGPALNRVARLLVVGHGGQVLVSGVTSDLVQGQMPPQSTLRDLGAHRLKDLARPEQIYQLLAPDLTDAFPPLRSLDAFPNNLPLQLTSFVGRDTEVAEIAALLGKHRLLTLIGSGGIGKTRVSLQVAANLMEAHADGTWFVEFAPLSDPELVATTIANAAQLVLPSDRDALDALVALLKGKCALLVFDNCEHLVAAAAAAASAIARGCPNVTIVASSRQGLGIAGEATYRMPSLDLPGQTHMTGLQARDAMRFGAIALFVARAEAADARFTFVDEDVPVVADICRRLDGIALAIELAAARVNILQPKELRARLDQRFRVLTGGSRDRLPRQQTLRALIDWSHDLLDERERTLFRRVGIFVGGFTLEGAVSVATDRTFDDLEVFDVLASLVDKSLVVAELAGEATRYRLLESARAYAGEKLEAAGERAALAKRHFDYLYDMFQRARSAYEASPREATIVALASELDDVRAALDWATLNDPVRGCALLTATPFFGDLDLQREGIARAEAFIERLEESDARSLARCWRFAALCAARLYESNRTFAAAQKAVSYARIAGDDDILFSALTTLSRGNANLRHLEAAAAAIEEAAAIEGQTAFQKADLLYARGFVAQMSGDPKTATQTGEQLVALHRSLGNLRGEMISTINLAEVAHENGETARAIQSLRDCSLGATPVLAVALQHRKMNLAGYLLAMDDVEAARAESRDVLRFWAVNDETHPHVGNTLAHVALANALDGDFVRAARLLGFAECCLQASGFERENTELVTHRRLLALLQGHFGEAELAAHLAAGAALTPAAAIDEGLNRQH